METSCGLGSCRPKWLQKFNSTKGFMFVYGLLGMIQAMSYVYFVSTLSTMEKRFKIQSKTTGLMMSGNEISQIFLSLFLSYYGGQRNRPLWIAWGVAISAISCYILAVPHLLYGPGTTALSLTVEYLNTSVTAVAAADVSHQDTYKEKTSLCSATDQRGSDCGSEDVGEFTYVPALVVFLSQFVLGIGTTLYYALGQTYIDDNTKKKNTPMLLGLSLSLRTVGPALAFILGYACLSLYIDPRLTPVIDKKDPRWLGAWWIGWLLLGTMMLMFAILMAMFPKRLSKTRINKVGVEQAANPECQANEIIPSAKKSDKEVEATRNGVADRNNEAGQVRQQPDKFQLVDNEEDRAPTLKEFPAALKRLLVNKLLMFNIVAAVFYILGGSAYITFITKYLEIQFHHSAAGASVAIGPTAIIAMTVGFLVSGCVISKFKPRPSYVLGWNVLVGFSFVIGEILFIFLKCNDGSLVGYRPGGDSISIINECNRECNCEGLKYSPVCLQEYQLTFYSACHAGCKHADYTTSKITYHNCSCMPAVEELGATVKHGACGANCQFSFLMFIVISCVMHGLGSSGKIGNILVNYRAVRTEDKSFAQGLSLLMVSLFALIPGPIIYGAMLDSTCLIWDESCGRKGNCWFYDKDKMRIYLNGTSAVLTFLGVLFDTVVWYLGRDLDLYGCEENEESKNER